MQVADKRMVSIRYLMKNSKGEVLENTMNGEPLQYVHGSGRILPSLEADLRGLRPGEEKTVVLSKDQGYADVDDTYTFRVIVDEVRLATEEELHVGGPVSVDNNACGSDCCC